MEVSLFQINSMAEKIQSLECVTKVLAFQRIDKTSLKRKLVISTNFLNSLGWFKGCKIKERVISSGQGLRITKVAIGEPNEKQVYERSYKKRTNTETLLDIRSQSKIELAFKGASHARILIKKDSIDIFPMFNSKAWKAKGARITIPDIKRFGDSIINVLRTLRDNKITHCHLSADTTFWQSTDSTILKIQLKRAGYVFDQESNNNLYLSNIQPTPSDFRKLEVAEAIKSKAPPIISTKPSTFIGFSAGFDAHILHKAGFNPIFAQEYAPNEARDVAQGKDKTERYCQTLVKNAPIHTLYNENIFECDYERIGNDSFNIDHSHVSLSCTEFSPLKTLAARIKAITQLKTTRDMFVPLLFLIEKQRPKTISVENVHGFKNSREGEIFRSGLKALGYKITDATLFAPDHGGLTLRKRYYLFASCIESKVLFLPPISSGPSKTSAWDSINFDFQKMSDKTHTKSVQLGISSKRIRLITPEKYCAPTSVRSQNRQVKDATYILKDNKYFMPTVDQLRTLAGMPNTFDMSFLNTELQTEIIGQGIDVPMHHAWTSSINKYFKNVMSMSNQQLELSL